MWGGVGFFLGGGVEDFWVSSGCSFLVAPLWALSFTCSNLSPQTTLFGGFSPQNTLFGGITRGACALFLLGLLPLYVGHDNFVMMLSFVSFQEKSCYVNMDVILHSFLFFTAIRKTWFVN